MCDGDSHVLKHIIYRRRSSSSSPAIISITVLSRLHHRHHGTVTSIFNNGKMGLFSLHSFSFPSFMFSDDVLGTPSGIPIPLCVSLNS
ncbi:hypothetical protein Lal_00021300 [Lupinus albus]|nr:hypothetical protein Lal_00021300 [Lupinus albus]